MGFKLVELGFKPESGGVGDEHFVTNRHENICFTRTRINKVVDDGFVCNPRQRIS